jgi:N6-L-threonylcarbamoyladenine synthase
MEAHLFAASIENPAASPPFVALLVSGGHSLLLHVPEWGTYHLLGETRDDAAGEAFDKVGKLLGLPFPGGPRLEVLARDGDPARYDFPRPMLRRNQEPADDDYFDFSFSGLKTAVATQVNRLEGAGTLEEERAHVAASFQAAVVDVLATKTMRAVEETGCPRVVLGGGVSANTPLRDELAARLEGGGELLHASLRFSLDNGAMVARAAAFRLDRGEVAGLDVTADANLPFPGLVRGSLVSLDGRR